MKKIISTIAIFALMLTACGCSDSSESLPSTLSDSSTAPSTQLEEPVTTSILEEQDKPDSKAYHFTQDVAFMEYKFKCEKDSIINYSLSGLWYESPNSFLVFIEAPLFAGIVLNIDNIEQAPAVCKEYVCTSVCERMTRPLDGTIPTQQVDSLSSVDLDGISAVKVTGFFTDSQSHTETPYVAYYLISCNSPMYIVCVSETQSPDAIDYYMAQFVSSIL